MSDQGLPGYAWIVDQLIALVRIFVWPVFLWFFTRRPDVAEHIRHLLAREWRVKVPGATVSVTTPEAAKRLPGREKERESKGLPKLYR